MNSGSSAIAILINSKTLSEKKLKLPLLASRCNFDNFLLYYRLFGTKSYFSFLEYAFFSNNIIPQKAILYPINLNCSVFVFNFTVGDTVICARTQKDSAGLFQLSAFASIFPRSMRNFFANYFIFLACSLLLRRRPAVNFDKHSSPFHTDILNYCFLAPRQFSLFEFFFSRICDAPITQMVGASRRLSDLAGAAFLNISKLFFQFSTISLHLNHIFFYCLFLQFAHKHFHFSLCFFRDKYFKFNSIPSLRSTVYTRSEHTVLQFSRWMPLFREESLKFAFPGIPQNFITFFFDKFFFFRSVCSHRNYRPFPVLKFYFLNALPKTNSFQFLIFFLNTTSRNFFFDVKEYRELTNSNPILNFQKNYLSFYKKRIENRVSFLSILYHYSQIMDFQFKFNFAKVLNKNNDYIANLMEDRLEFSFKTLQFNVSEHLIPSKKKTQLTAIALKSDYFEIMDSLDEEFLVLNSLLLHLDLSKKNTLVAYLTSLIAKFKDLLILSYFFFSKMRYMNKQFDQIRVTCSLLSSFFKLFPNLFIFSFLEFSRGMFISSLISNLISFKTSLFGVSNFLLKLDFTNHFILFSSSSSNFFSNLSFFRLSVSGLINYYFFRSHTFFYTKFFLYF